MPDVTPLQDATFQTDLKDLLRPYHSYKDDVLPLAGMYFLKRYTRKYETATATCQMVPLSEGLWHPLFICDPSWSYAKFTVTVNCHKDLAGLL
jgi:hypothetical protein